MLVALILRVIGNTTTTLTSAWTETRYELWFRNRVLWPGDCLGICDSLEIDIFITVRPYGFFTCGPSETRTGG